MKWAHRTITIIRMDAGVEPPWMVLRRVIVRCAHFMPPVISGTVPFFLQDILRFFNILFFLIITIEVSYLLSVLVKYSG
jgi:hypothetical protein